MDCCNNDNKENKDNTEKKNTNKGHMSHLWMMALCCGLPIILLIVILLFGSAFPTLRNALIVALPFICPVMMIFMIPMMCKRNDNPNDKQKPKQIEEKNE